MRQLCVKIIDFGVAKVLKRFGSLRALYDTPDMAPELFGCDYPPAADMLRIGVVACDMIEALPTFCVSPGKYMYYDTSETKENKLILKSSAKVKVRFHSHRARTD